MKRFLIRSKLATVGNMFLASHTVGSTTHWMNYTDNPDKALSWKTLDEARAVYDFIRTDKNITGVEIVVATADYTVVS